MSSFNSLDNEPEVELEPTQTSFNNSQNSRKTSSLWNYIDYETEDHLGIPVCKKCNEVFSKKSGNFTLECHLFSRHSIIIPKVRSNQTVLNFKCTTPWPIKKKSEQDYSVVI
jgi:hypothetical protein